LIVCGNVLLSGEHGFASIQGFSNEELVRGINELVDRIYQSERKFFNTSAALVKDFYKTEDHGFDNISRYYDYSVDPNMIINIRKNWETFDDYVLDMKKKYKRKVKSVLKKGSGLVKKSFSYDELVENRDILYDLYLNVVDKAKMKLFVLDPKMLEQLKLNLNEDFEVDGYYLNDRLVAYTTRIYNNDVLEGYSHGLDYSMNKGNEIYQNIMLDDVKVAIKNKMKRINLGRTSVGMKSGLGAEKADMSFSLKFYGVIPNKLIFKIQSVFKQDIEYCRNPFEVKKGVVGD